MGVNLSKRKEKAIRDLILMRCTRQGFFGGSDGGNYVPISQLANLTITSGDRGDFEVFHEEGFPSFPEAEEVIMKLVGEGQLEMKGSESVRLPPDNQEAGDKALIDKYDKQGIKLEGARFGKYYDDDE